VPNSVRLTSDTLVGREEELRSTLAVLHAVRDGRPGVVMVSGPAGIGKTRFVTTLADRLRADGAMVMVGACLDLGAGASPYSAFIAAFRSVDPPAVQVLDALTGAIEMRRSRLFELLRTTTEALARRRLTVLMVEDLHWSDRITRDALLYLTAMARDGRWALVVTFRDDAVAARPAVREFRELLHRDALVRVALDALSAEEVAAQIAGIAGELPAQEYAERIHRRSGGIPLLVEEVVAAEAAGTTGVPDHLRDLFLARVTGLGESAARATGVVAVVGDRCDARLVAGVLGLDRAKVAAALDRAAAADVLVSHGTGYRMRHELLREAVYGALPPGRRRQLHARVAGWLAAVPHPDPVALAHHWYQADEPTQAALANLAAADLADRVHALGAVHTHLERVLEHFDALPADRAAAVGGRAVLLARAAEAAWLSGAFQRSVALAEDCLNDVDAPPQVAVRWERLARYRWVYGDGVGAQQAHERSVAVLANDAPAVTRARVLSGYAWYLALANKTQDALSWSEQAVVAAHASGEPLERCRALLAWGYARTADEAGLAALWQARDLAVACDAGDELGRAHAGLDLALRRHGRIAEREQVLRDGLGYVAAHGLGASYAAVMNYLLAELLLDLGRWDDADQILEELAAHGVTGVPAMFTEAYRARLAAARGRPSAAACADRVLALSRDLPQQPIPRSVALCARAESCLWSGDPEEAMEYAGQAGARTSDPMLSAEAVAVRARAAADLAERARTQGQSVTGLPAATEAGAGAVRTDRHPQLRAFDATMGAELSRRDGMRDPQPWRKAVTAWEDAGDPYRAAYCRWRLAHALLGSRSGRREAARELDAARRTAQLLGARPLQGAVESLAAASRMRLGGGAEARVTGPAAVAAELGLTPRELEIVPLLVAGRTNAEIADAFVISPRTVGVHVSQILHKLGAARRTEAADIARRRGLVSG
jgi:DNA-binding CsgD family transcriptional regulator